jgi:predicted PurR-regulated permease PerM
LNRLAWYTALVLATLATAFLLWQFNHIALLFLFSLAVAATVRPAVDSLFRRGLSSVLALLLVHAAILGGIALALFTISGALFSELEQITNDSAVAYERVTRQWTNGSPIQQAVAERLPPPNRLYEALAGEQSISILENIFGVTFGIFGALGDIGIVLVLSIYWGADRVHFERLWLSLLPPERRASARQIWRTSEERIGGYLRSEFAQALLAGLLLGLGFWIIGLRYPTLLALAGTILWLIPVFGLILIMIPALLIGLIDGLSLGILAAVYTFIVLLGLEMVVEPRLFKQRNLISPLLVVLTMMALADAFGLLGLVLAPPLAASIQIIAGGLLQQTAPVTSATVETRMDELRERLTAIRALTDNGEQSLSPEVGSIVERLKNLMERAHQAL